MPILTSKVQKRGQVTIPIEFRERLGLSEGTIVTFKQTSEGILITPQELIAMQAFDEIGRLLKEKSITLDEMLESGRKIRNELVAEKYGLKDGE